MQSAPSTAWSHSGPPLPTNSPLIQALTDYDRLMRRRFHVPAHSGSAWGQPALLCEPFRYDLTELDGLDVLSEPAGCLKEAQQQVARLFGVAHSYFLVNGASVGLQAAMLASLKPGDRVLLPRNVHRAVLSGLILTGAEPVWFLPECLPEWGLWGAVTLAQVKAQCQAYPDIQALILTSPTYEGLGSDVVALATWCRQRDILLIVDEAHGGLWPFSDALPPSAVAANCDAVIHSLHKSGGSLTQTALTHLPHGSRIDAQAFQQSLNTLQTTSPSYLLMASLEAACHALVSPAGEARIAELLRQTQAFRTALHGDLKVLALLSPEKTRQPNLFDPCKLYFASPAESGEEWGARLENENRIAYEAASPHGVLYLANLGLEASDFELLRHVLLAEDARLMALGEKKARKTLWTGVFDCMPDLYLSPREAFFAPGTLCPVARAESQVAKQTVVHCPPGIPILMPGERIQAHHLPLLPPEGVWVVR